MVFMPKKKTKLTLYYYFESVKQQNLKVLGWRDVPVDVTNLGQIAEKEPTVNKFY
jgi:glutamate synthase (ferredoxin)